MATTTITSKNGLETHLCLKPAGLFFVLVMFSCSTNIVSLFLGLINNDNMLTKDPISTGERRNGQEKDTRTQAQGLRRICSSLWYVFFSY